ncbi:hypothetical protein EDB81DRAFT_305901 [Dactylonectria macrodidyma]|uniref:Uncharacterized protein n=1 Tax=Dactylonectria macrodidyma TaxID=307937 RepID=A0A9P9IBE3_9HYPO|nr:hypothetical protein EDB81DRAFT_305901 [Dactylonectria macrodidyma]
MGAQQSMPLIEPPSDPQVLSSEFFDFLQQLYNNFNYTERSLRIFESHFIQRRITHTNWKESHGRCPCSRQSQNSTKLSNYQTIWRVWGAKAPVTREFEAVRLTNIKHQTIWRIWGAKAPVTREFEAVRLTNIKHQTTWEIWGAKAPVTRESKGYSPHKLIYQAIRETWGAKALVTKQSNASVVIEALSCFSPTKVFLRF